MRHSSLRHFLLAAAAGLPAVAHANTGVGLGFFLGMSTALLPALVVIIPLEALILRFALPVRFLRVLWFAFVANLLSTVLGAIIGAALDRVAGTQLRSVGVAGFAGAVLLMYAITVAIEHAVVRRRLGEVPRKAVLRAILIANAVSYVLLVLWTHFMGAAMDSHLHRSYMTEAVNVGGVAKTAAAEYFQAHGRFRADRKEKPTKYTRRVTTTDTGRITVEIDYPPLDVLNGQALVLEPELHEGKIHAWHCYVPQAPFKYFPANCRFRSAAESAKVYGRVQ